LIHGVGHGDELAWRAARSGSGRAVEHPFEGVEVWLIKGAAEEVVGEAVERSYCQIIEVVWDKLVAAVSK